VSKERPILFSAPMVRAILEGRKTQTRRVVKNCKKFAEWDAEPDSAYDVIIADDQSCAHFLVAADHGFTDAIPCPYGQPGDLLWVRETTKEDCWGSTSFAVYCADSALSRIEWWYSRKVCPSIFMPRWASRITLRIKSVRVERLNQISREDAIAEGVTSRPNCYGFRNRHDGWSADWSRVGQPSKYAMQGKTLCESDISLSSPQLAFQNLWERINGPDSWDANPWVWVIEFERVQ
jgi:hypothetical protein